MSLSPCLISPFTLISFFLRSTIHLAFPCKAGCGWHSWHVYHSDLKRNTQVENCIDIHAQILKINPRSTFIHSREISKSLVCCSIIFKRPRDGDDYSPLVPSHRTDAMRTRQGGITAQIKWPCWFNLPQSAGKDVKHLHWGQTVSVGRALNVYVSLDEIDSAQKK